MIGCIVCWSSFEDFFELFSKSSQKEESSPQKIPQPRPSFCELFPKKFKELKDLFITSHQNSDLAQRKRVWLITIRSIDRNDKSLSHIIKCYDNNI